MLAALDALGVLTLVGIALFVGGLLLRGVPAAGLVIGAVIVGFGLGIPAIVINDNQSEAGGGGGSGASAGSEASSNAAGGTSTTAEKESSGSSGGGATDQGKLIFTQTCGTCHTLQDAGTSGNVGPVLDQVKPDKALVLKAIKEGGLGSGTMPANLVQGKEAEAVATYVSSVAGK
jgi:mono/diheme cytochrome c family protein